MNPTIRPTRGGFTLIELLIVVMIIAVLAVIAVPNFLEAQTRAKVARVQTELRTLAVAIEAYRADAGAWPMNDGVYNNAPAGLSTPIAYLSQSFLIDPFKTADSGNRHGALANSYTYTEVVNLATASRRAAIGVRPPIEAIDSPLYNPGARAKYGDWRLASDGPDRVYILRGHASGDDPLDPEDRLSGIDVPYDPTNGTVSGGNILRTQRRAVAGLGGD